MGVMHMEPVALRMIGYARCSTHEQAVSGLGLVAQEDAITRECERRGWRLERLVRDEGASGKSLDRPGLQSALRAIADGQADGLVCAKLDRLTRSVTDFAALLLWLEDADASFVALDMGVDTSSPSGRLVANLMASVAEWERSVIAARTREGLAAARAEGRPISQPAVSDNDDLRAMIEEMRAEGATFREIADSLNEASVPTVRGGACWRASSLQRTLSGPRRRTRAKVVALPAIPRRRPRRSRVVDSGDLAQAA